MATRQRRTTSARRLITLVVVLAALTLLAAACGGGGSAPSPSPSATPTPPATPNPIEATYLQQLKSAVDQIHQNWDALNTYRKQAFASTLTEQQRVANAKEFANRYQTFANDAKARLSAITPPGGLETQHKAIVDAATGLITLSQNLIARLAQIRAVSDTIFGDIFFQADGSALEQHFRDACHDLQVLARRIGSDVDLQCVR